MRTFESSLVTDFFKDQSWRCRAAVGTLRNRMDDDWVDLFLLHHFEKVSNSFISKRCVIQWGEKSEEIDSWTQNYKEAKFGWIDTFLMSIILQVITKYLILWILDNFTMQDSNKTKDADCHITPQSEWKGRDIWSTAADDGYADV